MKDDERTYRRKRTVNWGRDPSEHGEVQSQQVPWPDLHRDPEPEEQAASMFTIRLSKRDRERLERVQAKLGTATLNRAIKAMIRSAHWILCPDED